MTGRFGRWMFAALALVCGCETVENARREQARLDPYGDEAVAATNTAARVNLKGLRFVDYVAWALRHRPTVEEAYLNVSNAVLELRKVSSERDWQLDISGGYGQSTANRTGHFSWHQARGKGQVDITADLLIYDWGRLDAREKRARENVIEARRALEDAELTVFNEVAGAYFTLLRNDALLEVARTNEFQYAEHLRQAESLYAEGEVKKLDVLKARVDLSDARLAVINASNDVVTAGAAFVRTLGLTGARAAREDVIANAGAALLEPGRADLAATAFGAAEALAAARTNAPALKALRAKVRAASADVDYAVADILPSLTLSSAFAFSDPAWNWSWGFRAVQTLVDGWRKRYAVDQAVVALERARAQLEDAEQTLARDLAVAAATRDNARESLATARVEVAQAKENLDTVVEQYRLGDASRIDFTDAAGGFARALGTRVKAFYAGEIAEAELIRLIGTTLNP